MLCELSELQLHGLSFCRWHIGIAAMAEDMSQLFMLTGCPSFSAHLCLVMSRWAAHLLNEQHTLHAHALRSLQTSRHPHQQHSTNQNSSLPELQPSAAQAPPGNACHCILLSSCIRLATTVMCLAKACLIPPCWPATLTTIATTKAMKPQFPSPVAAQVSSTTAKKRNAVLTVARLVYPSHDLSQPESLSVEHRCKVFHLHAVSSGLAREIAPVWASIGTYVLPASTTTDNEEVRVLIMPCTIQGIRLQGAPNWKPLAVPG